MADLTSRLIVRLIDGVSGPARAAAGALGRLNRASNNGAIGGGLVAMQQRVTEASKRNSAAIAGLQNKMFAAAAGAWALKGGFTGVVGPAVSFESALADVAKVTSFDDTELAKFGKSLRRIATDEIPVAVDELAALAAAAAQSGVPEVDLEGFTKMTAKAAVAWEMTGQQAGENLAKIRAALGLTNKQTALYADAINHVSDNTAASSHDLVDYTRRVASQGEFFGFAKEQTLAFGAAMIGAGAQSEVAATSFRNMGRALTKGASAPKRMQSAYKKLGLTSTGVAKAMQKDAVGTTLDVIQRLGELPEYMQASVMSDLFGDEARALAPLLNNVELLQDALRLVAEEQEYANSVGKEFERRAQTTAYAWRLFKNRVKDIGLALAGTLLPNLKKGLNFLGPFAKRLTEFSEANSGVIVATLGAAAALIGLRVGLLGLGIAGRLAYGGLLSIANAALFVGRALAFVTIAPLAAALRAARTAMVGFAASAAILGKGGAFKAIGASLVSLLAPAKLLAGAFAVLKGALMFSGVGLAVGAIAAAGTAIYQNWSGIKAMFSGIADGFAKGLGPAAKAFEPIANFAERISSAISGLVGPLQASDEMWKSWGETIGGTVASGVNAVIGALSRVVGFLSSAVDMAVRFGSAISNALSWGGGSAPAMPSGRGAAPSAQSGGAAPPARVRGGPVSRGRSYIVGEKRPEIFTPGSSGYIHPRTDVGVGTGGSSGPINVTQHFTINGATDPSSLLATIRREMERAAQDVFRGVFADARTGFGY
ncbi:hypothetical protein W911_06885 [Hyphomicrobium nitrativorans NL23]|uniref:Phage tail tape measure protein domain-containing protein n=1 Tax=Hyphomicrobium nitrativorans NL23 TaxID=1029756 RepID=V5SJ01_9HYPH|nr:phage tail tape measure protein [Hyphomicrobium nitrativorans]AHB50065.1 hypothetical protein W911_06885 [Hyphomicrobium nitrativorans NL23]